MESFAQAVRAVEKKCASLITSAKYTIATLPADMPDKGIYVFSKGRRVLYVGRTNKLQKRLQYHMRNNHNQATFAFLPERLHPGV